MIREDIVRFATRDWRAVEEGKAAYWADWKRRMSPAEVLHLGENLRRHVLTVRPDWPSEPEREQDRATHARVTEALRAVADIRSR
jgi:hypothetical protein